MKLILLYILALTVYFVSGESLLERLYSSSRTTRLPRNLRIEKHNQLNDEDAPIPKRNNIDLVGSFHGRPIIARQQDVYIDDNGVPVPIQSFAPYQRYKFVGLGPE